MITCRPALVSDYLLVQSREEGEVLTNLKLQKLLYYTQAWHLTLFDDPVFEEDFQAWVHGPVLRSQYDRFRKFRWTPITENVDKPEIPSRLEEHIAEIIDVL